MKKWLCMVLCAGMMFGSAGCGGTEPTTEPEQQEERVAEEQEDAESEAADTFDFTIDEFVQAVDERLTEDERTLLSEYELVDDGGKLMYKINDTTSLMAEINEENRKVKGFILYATPSYLSDEELSNYVSLVLNSLATVDPDDMAEIYEALNLGSTKECMNFAEGTNAKYIYELKDGVGKISILPAALFE